MRVVLERTWGYEDVRSKLKLPDCELFFARNDRGRIAYIRASKDGTLTEHRSMTEARGALNGKPVTKQRSSKYAKT